MRARAEGLAMNQEQNHIDIEAVLKDVIRKLGGKPTKEHVAYLVTFLRIFQADSLERWGPLYMARRGVDEETDTAH
jgi:hypothetical protein